MPTTIFEAKPYDEAKARRRTIQITTAIVVVLAVAFLLWWFRYWPIERRVDKFFDALQSHNYEQAYALWMNDPNWKQHPEKYARYPFNEFMTDWGPSGEWGLIKTHKVDGAAQPHGGGSGVIVQVTVNDRAEKARVWVEKSDKTMHFSPY